MNWKKMKRESAHETTDNRENNNAPTAAKVKHIKKSVHTLFCQFYYIVWLADCSNCQF